MRVMKNNANEARRNIILKNQREKQISETDQLKEPEETLLGLHNRISKNGR